MKTGKGDIGPEVCLKEGERERFVSMLVPQRRHGWDNTVNPARGNGRGKEALKER